MKQIDIEAWSRKEPFEFFSSMEHPFFGISAEVDGTKAYEKAKLGGFSFFAWYLHAATLAVHNVDELKYRLVNGSVVLYDSVQTQATIGRKDGSFGFINVAFTPDFSAFNEALKHEIEDVQRSTGLRLRDNDAKKDVVRYSIIPWFSFTGVSHPVHNEAAESVPTITIGKFQIRDGRKILPVAVHAHHGFADAFHVAQFLALFQKNLDA
jgi:chloramphenicol O-acetyltransferase type A